MSVSYRMVQWNRQKVVYDLVLLAGVAAYIAGYQWVAPLQDQNADAMNVGIRAYGSAAFILLHVILSIGPLCRLSPRFLPFLYNRRHMGVTLAFLAAYHGYLVLNWYHQWGNIEPLVSLFASNTDFGSFIDFPFELLGVGALVILILMAATSHDFWLTNLTAPVWKGLHMCVYLAYALLVSHVVLGAIQSSTGSGFATLTIAGSVWIVGLHVFSGWRERRTDQPETKTEAGLIEICAARDIPEKRAKIVCASGERIAVFRYDGKISALSNVCQHQNGPLGEGQVVDGLVTCPWHGYQYRPACGSSPPPFTEKVPTFDVVVRDGRVFVDPRPHAPGTAVEPVMVEDGGKPVVKDSDTFYVGYLPRMPRPLLPFVRFVVGLLLLVGSAGLAIVVPFLHDDYSFARSEWPTKRDFIGILQAKPVTHLVVARPGVRGERRTSRYVLMGQGKTGPLIDVNALDGKAVRVHGWLVFRDAHTMIATVSAEEVAAEESSLPAMPAHSKSLGTRTLRGEIVDSKCYVGTMRPGNSKVHRACAARCIAGGVPPMLISRDANDNELAFFMVTTDGSPVNQGVLPFVAEPVEITGEILRMDDLFVIKADPVMYQRL
jgi:nitrite reductase/ring-hydroxylating ferredoxin subunit